MRNYAMRVNVYKTTNGQNGLVSLSEETMKLFTKPYVTVKKWSDRLAFVPWETKTGQGMYVVSNGKIQMGMPSDCELLKEFCGEYDDVVQTENGMVYVKLSDRRDFKTVGASILGTKHTNPTERSPRVIPTSTMSLVEMLEQEIGRANDRLDSLEEELREAEKLVLEYQSKCEVVRGELKAYKAALFAAKGVNRGEDVQVARVEDSAEVV